MLKFLLKLFQSQKLKPQNRVLILNALLKHLNALPIADLIQFDLNGTVKINGKDLSTEQVISLRESAVNIQKNWFYKVLKEQLAYEAIKIGIYSAQTTEQLVFSKAILWIQARENELITKLSGQSDEDLI